MGEKVISLCFELAVTKYTKHVTTQAFLDNVNQSLSEWKMLSGSELNSLCPCPLLRILLSGRNRKTWPKGEHPPLITLCSPLSEFTQK